MSRPIPLLTRIWMSWHDDSESIGDRVVHHAMSADDWDVVADRLVLCAALIAAAICGVLMYAGVI